MTKLLPLSAGLLISMAIRYDHSFGCHLSLLEVFDKLPINPENTDPLTAKQIILLREVKLIYDNLQTNTPDNVTDQQLLEEATGIGFYNSDKEELYRSCATSDALAEAKVLAAMTVVSPRPTPLDKVVAILKEMTGF